MISGVSRVPTRYSVPATQQTTVAPAPAVAVPQVTVEAGGGIDAQSLMSTITGVFQSIGNFFKGLFDKLFHRNTTPAPGTLDPNLQAIATQYGLLATADNVQTFMKEVQGYGTPGPGGFQTLGPGSSNAQAIGQVQSALKSLGYTVNATGQYDAATVAAVKAFKQANGITQTYKLANGSPAVNEYFDYNTYQKLSQKLSAPTTTSVASTTPPQPTQPTPPAPAAPAAPQPGTVNWQAMAQQYKLLPAEDNVQAFMAEVQSYQRPDAHGFRVIGPGYPSGDEVKQIQGALAKIGYKVSATGTWDTTTSQAIMDFKAKNGFHQSYKSADGNWAINEFADFNTLQKLSSLV